MSAKLSLKLSSRAFQLQGAETRAPSNDKDLMQSLARGPRVRQNRWVQQAAQGRRKSTWRDRIAHAAGGAKARAKRFGQGGPARGVGVTRWTAMRGKRQTAFAGSRIRHGMPRVRIRFARQKGPAALLARKRTRNVLPDRLDARHAAQDQGMEGGPAPALQIRNQWRCSQNATVKKKHLIKIQRREGAQRAKMTGTGAEAAQRERREGIQPGPRSRMEAAPPACTTDI